MGMYTEMIFGAKLKKNVPNNIIEIIQLLVDGKESEIKEKPTHPFFETERQWLLASGGSYYFAGAMRPEFKNDKVDKQWSLFARTNIKNYGNEIEKFIDWIKPYCEQGSGSNDMIAVVIYEEEETPTIYYLNAVT